MATLPTTELVIVRVVTFQILSLFMLKWVGFFFQVILMFQEIMEMALEIQQHLAFAQNKTEFTWDLELNTFMDL